MSGADVQFKRHWEQQCGGRKETVPGFLHVFQNADGSYPKKMSNSASPRSLRKLPSSRETS